MPDVKLLTLNLHCLVEPNLEEKQRQIADLIRNNDVDIILFQEAAQPFGEPVLEKKVREGNYALTVQRLLQQQNNTYHLYYEPFKESFGAYDEGLAILSKQHLTLEAFQRISNTNSYKDWHTRYVLTYQATFGQTTLYLANTHFGWSDENERFEDQVDLALETLPDDALGIIAGDFNVTPDSPEYQYLMDQGLYDAFDVKEFQDKPTHINDMDIHSKGSRIDYVMSTKPLNVTKRLIVFDRQRVSDHYGLLVSFHVK